MPEAWSREEVEAAVADYFAMLSLELQGLPYNKAEHNRNLRRVINNRPPGSVERKHQNISAILIEFGYPYIDGYKPLGNYQELLKAVVEDRIASASALEEAVARTVDEPVQFTPSISDILSIQVERPVNSLSSRPVYDRPRSHLSANRRNYLEIEARNRSLGTAGEELVLRFERERLRRAGESRLADRVEHVSQTQGDHLGYDIHSFEPSGRDILIEVKTTRFGPMTPFFASRNEVAASEANQDLYQLYRVFGFRQTPRLFTLPGSIQSSCALEPISFIGIPN